MAKEVAFKQGKPSECELDVLAGKEVKKTAQILLQTVTEIHQMRMKRHQLSFKEMF